MIRLCLAKKQNELCKAYLCLGMCQIQVISFNPPDKARGQVFIFPVYVQGSWGTSGIKHRALSHEAGKWRGVWGTRSDTGVFPPKSAPVWQSFSSGCWTLQLHLDSSHFYELILAVSLRQAPSIISYFENKPSVIDIIAFQKPQKTRQMGG